METKKSILILDVPDRRSIPVVGSLGTEYNFHYLVPIRKGFSIEPLVKIALILLKPRHTKKMIFLSFETAEDIFLCLMEHLRKNNYDLVMAFSERSTAILCDYAVQIKKFTKIAHGEFRNFNILNDKLKILEICREVGVPTPRFKSLDCAGDIENIAEIGFPLVLKCRLASGVKQAFRVCHSVQDIRSAYDELSNSSSFYPYFPCDKLVAEEFIRGKIFDAGVVVINTHIAAAVTQERVWTIPPEGGFGAYNVTRDLPELIDYGNKIFKKIPWKGPAQLEFIFDNNDKTFKLIEINPRFWGTTGLAVKAGVNVGGISIKAALGDLEIQTPIIAPPGIDFAWLLQETLIAERMRGEKGNIIWRHIKKIFSKEINNFTYSIGANFLLAIPHLLHQSPTRRKNNNSANSLAKQLFE